MSTRWLEVTAGQTIRFSSNFIPISPDAAFLALRRTGTAPSSNILNLATRFVTNNFLTPPTWRLRVTDPAHTITSVDAPFPAEEVVFPFTFDRTSWSYHKLEYRLRTSTYDGSTYVDDGELEIRADGSVVLSLSGQAYHVPVSATGDTITFVHSAPGGDAGCAWGAFGNSYASVVGEVATHADLAYSDNFASNDGSGWVSVSTNGAYMTTVPYYYGDVMSSDPSFTSSSGTRDYSGAAKTFLNVLKPTATPPDPPPPTPSLITDEGGDNSIPSCCDEHAPNGGGDTGLNPDPVGMLPPWMATCTGGGLVDEVADLTDGESWL